MRVITRMIEDEVYDAVNESGQQIRIDMRELSKRQHQSPVELLLSSVAACGAVDIVIMLKKRKKTIVDFETIIDGERNPEPPRRFLKIHCHYKITSPDVTEDELEKVSRLSLEKYCSVATTLNIPVTFSVEVIQS